MKHISMLIAIALLCSCNTSSNNQEVVQKQETTLTVEEELGAIEEFRMSFQKAIKEKRYSDLGSMKTDDMIGIGPASSEWLKYQREREVPMGMFSYDSIIMNPIETVILNDSMAYDFGTSKVYYTNAEGKSIELEDSFMVLLKKKGGHWKIFRELASGTIK